MPLRAVTFVLAALITLHPGAARAAAGDDAVAKLAREWYRRLEARRPDLASAYGSSSAASRLLAITDVTLAEDMAWLPRFRARLASVTGPLSPAAAADRDGLLAWAFAESAAVAADGRWRRDPGAYVELITDALNEPRDARRPGACERAQRAARRFTRVPDVLRGAQVALTRPERVATERAVARLDTLIVHWRAAYPARFTGCRESYRQADLVEGDTTAIRAASAYARWLRDHVLPAAEAGAPPAERTPLPPLRRTPR